MTSAIPTERAALSFIYAMPAVPSGMRPESAQEIRLEFPEAQSYFNLEFSKSWECRFGGRFSIIRCNKATGIRGKGCEMLSCEIDRIRALRLFAGATLLEVEIPEITGGHEYVVTISFQEEIRVTFSDARPAPEARESLIRRAKTELPSVFTDKETIPDLFYDATYRVLSYEGQPLLKYMQQFAIEINLREIGFDGCDASSDEVRSKMKQFYRSCFADCSLEALNELNCRLKSLEGELKTDKEIKQFLAAIYDTIGREAIKMTFIRFIEYSLRIKSASPEFREILVQTAENYRLECVALVTRAFV